LELQILHNHPLVLLLFLMACLEVHKSL